MNDRQNNLDKWNDVTRDWKRLLFLLKVAEKVYYQCQLFLGSYEIVSVVIHYLF